jgi:hypothetical protein
MTPGAVSSGPLSLGPLFFGPVGGVHDTTGSDAGTAGVAGRGAPAGWAGSCEEVARR